jgi:hypothetical protein
MAIARHGPDAVNPELCPAQHMAEVRAPGSRSATQSRRPTEAGHPRKARIPRNKWDPPVRTFTTEGSQMGLRASSQRSADLAKKNSLPLTSLRPCIA